MNLGLPRETVTLRDERPLVEPEIRLRPMEEGDLAEVVAIERASFPSPWAAEAFRAEMEPPGFCFVAESRERLGGYIVFRLLLGEVHILNLAVAPEFRGRGIGKRLLRLCVDLSTFKGAVSFWLEVREGNHPAIHLYRRMGFCIKGRRRGYYRDTGEDALLMELFMGGRVIEG